MRFTSKFNKTDEFHIGVAAAKFGKPDWSVLSSGGNYRLDPRIHVELGLSSLMSEKIRFMPNVTYQRIMGSAASTLVAQGMFDYLFNEEKRVVLKAGLGYRSGAGFGDALQVMVGTDIRDIRVLFGYDVNISPLSAASGSLGGFELSAQYIGRIYKRPKPDPVIFCPRF